MLPDNKSHSTYPMTSLEEDFKMSTHELLRKLSLSRLEHLRGVSAHGCSHHAATRTRDQKGTIFTSCDEVGERQF